MARTLRSGRRGRPFKSDHPDLIIMREYHPFNNFMPKNTRYLILGSFVAKKSPEYDWFYSTKRNQFWPILENIYGKELKTKKQKKDLLKELDMAMTDIIKSCERKKNNSLDTNLVNIEYNIEGIKEILSKDKIEKIFFTSRFVEKGYSRVFKEYIDKYADIELITLPSPSPRYAMISFKDKVDAYKRVFPEF